MNKSRNGLLIPGIILLLLGLFLLAMQINPSLARQLNMVLSWPFIIIGVGGVFFLAGLIYRTSGFTIPGCVIGGIGGILYYQNQTGNWESWAYIWALIPGFVGVGILLGELLEGKGIAAIRDSWVLLLISTLLFAIFGSFLGNIAFSGILLPAALIIFGGWMLIDALRKKKG